MDSRLTSSGCLSGNPPAGPGAHGYVVLGGGSPHCGDITAGKNVPWGPGGRKVTKCWSGWALYLGLGLQKTSLPEKLPEVPATWAEVVTV